MLRIKAAIVFRKLPQMAREKITHTLYAQKDGQAFIRVTEDALARLQVIMADEKDARLRIKILSGGCSGFQYNMSFDPELHSDDLVFEDDLAAIVIDEVSFSLLQGLELDYQEDLMGSAFQLKNPNSASSCGCGNSFSV